MSSLTHVSHATSRRGRLHTTKGRQRVDTWTGSLSKCHGKNTQIDLGIRNAGVKGKAEQAFKGAEESGKFLFCVCVVIIIFFSERNGES